MLLCGCTEGAVLPLLQHSLCGSGKAWGCPVSAADPHSVRGHCCAVWLSPLTSFLQLLPPALPFMHLHPPIASHIKLRGLGLLWVCGWWAHGIPAAGVRLPSLSQSKQGWNLPAAQAQQPTLWWGCGGPWGSQGKGSRPSVLYMMDT